MLGYLHKIDTAISNVIIIKKAGETPNPGLNTNYQLTKQQLIFYRAQLPRA